MLHEVDPGQALLEKTGDVTGVEIFNNQILVAIYQRPERTKSGIILTDNTRAEDKFQGKVGLVLKKGPTAFVADAHSGYVWEKPIDVGDWVFFRTSDSWPLKVNDADCRILDDIKVRGRVAHPDLIW